MNGRMDGKDIWRWGQGKELRSSQVNNGDSWKGFKWGGDGVAAWRTDWSGKMGIDRAHTGDVVEVESFVLADWPGVGERKQDAEEFKVTAWMAVLPYNPVR